MRINLEPDLRLAEYRYLYEPEFHARVEVIVQTIQREQGIIFDAHDRSLACFVASVALATLP